MLTEVPSAYEEPRKPFPARRVVRRRLEDVDEHVLEAWAASLELEPVLGPMITTEEQRIRVLRLLYTYRHLNGEDLTNLPSTDLITHRVRVPPGAKPASSKSQKRWPAHTEWWMRKLVQDGLRGGIYELTEPANGRLSLWNARAVMVDKVEDPQPTDEPRMTFDYSRVPELLPGSHLELSSKVHDHLSNPRHGCLFSADLKHAYLTIPLHKDDRHYFAFTISGIGQLQPKRMQQGSKSAGFTMNELVYRAFGFIPSPNPEPSLLHSDDPAIPPALTFYMDDFFGGFRNFEDLFSFLIDHFFPRIDWARLVLAFRKLRLFARSIKALGVTHTVGGLVNVLEDRVAKIARWPVPKDQTGVRAFLGTVGITRRWVKNFSELARPLSRLTGKVDFRWTQAEQFSFEILRVKCSTQSSMHGIDLSHEVHFYTDASGFGAGLAVTQYQTTQSAKGFSLVEVPVIYDSFTFNVNQRKYPTYKKELCALVKFCQKYDYLCKHPYLTTIIHTDHRPLVHFLKSDIHEGIYGHWADVLRRLNITIRYIPGPRNKVADGLSRTVFNEDFKFQDLPEKEPLWKWSDSKSGYQSFLGQLDEQQRNKVLVEGTLGGSEVFLTQAKPPVEGYQTHNLPRLPKPSWQEAYHNSGWFGRLYQAHDSDPASVVLTPHECTQALSYRLDTITGILWKDHRGSLLPCIPESLVISIFRAAHDDAGHWAKAGTMAKLRGFVYWPDQTQDVERYIAGCLACARHGPATKSQLLQPIAIHGPFRLLGIDFIGPLPTSKAGNRFILHMICYFSRFSSGFPRKTANAEDVISAFEELFLLYGKPKGIYWDRGQHFISQEVQDFLTMAGIGFSYSPSGSSMSTGMVEVGNKILEDVLRKEDDWEATFRKSIRSLNSRIIKHLTYAPCEILLGLPPVPDLLDQWKPPLTSDSIRANIASLTDPLKHSTAVNQYITHRSQVHDRVSQLSIARKEGEAARYNKGVRQRVFEPGDLVMLYQKDTGKLQPRWRGPFVVEAFASPRGVSYLIKQTNGRRIKGTFHGNHLKLFIARTGYLSDQASQLLPQQTIRPSKRQRVRLHLRPPKPPTSSPLPT